MTNLGLLEDCLVRRLGAGQGKFERINKLLMKDIDQAALFECRRQIMNANSDGWYEEESSVALWSERWLVVSHGMGSYCAYAHNAEFGWDETYDLNKSQLVHLSQWFKAEDPDSDSKSSSSIKALPKLQKLVLKYSQSAEVNRLQGADEAVCVDPLKKNTYFALSLREKGMRFREPLQNPNNAAVVKSVQEG